MPTNYLPSRQLQLRDFCADMSAYLSADPESYSLSEAQAAAYAVIQTAYAEALAVATNRLTRSPANIEAKDEAKKALIAETRKLVDIIQAWPEMTNQKRSLLGITVRDSVMTPAAIPGSAPEVNITSVSGRLLNVALRKDSGESRGKPRGVRCAWLYTCTSEETPTVFEDFKFRGEARKTDTQIIMPESVAPGTKVWVSACWVNTAGKPGPASLPVATWTTHGTMKVAA